MLVVKKKNIIKRKPKIKIKPKKHLSKKKIIIKKKPKTYRKKAKKRFTSVERLAGLYEKDRMAFKRKIRKK